MSRVLLALISAILVLAVSGCAGLATGAQDDSGARTGSKQAKARQATPQPTTPPIRIEDLLGTDGRLTVLILGSDARDGVIGSRTDAIIVGTIDPVTGKITMVSLPRDTVNVPIAPGQAYSERINSLFWEYERSTGKTKPALKKTKQALAYAFGTEIDYYALLEFDGLMRLINSIGGIEVTLDKALVDPTLHLGKNGLKLKAGRRELDGRKALAFSRSRHSDSDYDRSRRQQQVLAAAATKVRQRGQGALPALVEVSRKKIVTDMPLRAAPALLELAATAQLEKVKSIVLEPDRWARHLPGTYVITPRVAEVQRMFDRFFKPVE